MTFTIEKFSNRQVKAAARSTAFSILHYGNRGKAPVTGAKPKWMAMPGKVAADEDPTAGKAGNEKFPYCIKHS